MGYPRGGTPDPTPAPTPTPSFQDWARAAMGAGGPDGGTPTPTPLLQRRRGRAAGGARGRRGGGAGVGLARLPRGRALVGGGDLGAAGAGAALLDAKVQVQREVLNPVSASCGKVLARARRLHMDMATAEGLCARVAERISEARESEARTRARVAAQQRRARELSRRAGALVERAKAVGGGAELRAAERAWRQDLRERGEEVIRMEELLDAYHAEREGLRALLEEALPEGLPQRERDLLSVEQVRAATLFFDEQNAAFRAVVDQVDDARAALRGVRSDFEPQGA